MTKTLQQAIERLQRETEERQDALAALLVHELDEDERWAKSTAANFEKLSGHVQEVLDADHRGECEPLDLEKL